MQSPPGSGESMMAKRILTILPSLGKSESDGNKFITEYNFSDYFLIVKRPIEEIMNAFTNKHIVSSEGKDLNEYFFKDEIILKSE